MAEIVLAMASSHGPQLHTTVDKWHLRVASDKKRKLQFRGETYDYDQLVELRKPGHFDEKSSMDAQKGYHARSFAAMDRLAEVWEDKKPDVCVIFGNDQDEVFQTEQINPAFMVFYGDKIPHHLHDGSDPRTPPGWGEEELGHAPPEYREYSGEPDLGLHIIRTMMEQEVDVAASRQWPANSRNGASHAFGHIYRAVMRDKVVPNVPLYQNTLFPPNQPTSARSYRFGEVVAQAIKSWDSDKRVAVIASGGMTHFVIDEEFDTRFIDALRTNDRDYFASIPLSDMQSGTSELKSWISLAGFLGQCGGEMQLVDYVPCYRSPAGTGTANAFLWWDLEG